MFDFDQEASELYIYDEIGPAHYGLVDDSMVIAALKQMEGNHVTVRLNTPGGSVDLGIGIYNALKRHKGGVTTVVDSLAASMGSYLLQAGERRLVAKNAMLMVHDPWTIALGNATQLRKDADILEKYGKRMIPEYAARSGKSEDDVRAIMEQETWYVGKEIVDAGFADEVDDRLTAQPMAAGLSRISAKAPRELLELAKQQEQAKAAEFPRRRKAVTRSKRLSEIRQECLAKIQAELSWIDEQKAS